ncbi:hypothetical protein ACHAXR_004134, partial [Thalassiosira sp. AJA248-18]
MTLIPTMSNTVRRVRGGNINNFGVVIVLSAAAIFSASLIFDLWPSSTIEASLPTSPKNNNHHQEKSSNNEYYHHRRLLAMPLDSEDDTNRNSNSNYRVPAAASAAAAAYAASAGAAATTNTKTNNAADDYYNSGGGGGGMLQPQHQHGQPISSSQPNGGVQINMLRRAKDIVSESDVPFLLQVPHTSSETIYNIMTQCYGLVGKHYDTPTALDKARNRNVVDNLYVSSHDRPASMFKNFGERFHFLSTPHYQEGMGLLTLKHKGRIILMMRHPSSIAESMYLTRPGVERGGAGDNNNHIEGLMRYVNSTDYYDNWMTRMLANVPKHVTVTEEHFREARMILENKFLIGMTSDMTETVKKRLKVYFGWKNLPEKDGCDMEQIKKGSMSLPPSSLEEGGHEWRFIRKRNRYDMKLYARGMAVFGDQKMRVPIHSTVRARQIRVVEEAFGHLRNINDERDSSDIPFFWHIPKASGTTVKETLSDCYGLVRTEMIKPPASLEVFPNKHVLNIDLSTPNAIAVAKKMGVSDRELADVFVSQLSLEGSTVFSTYHMGRAFTIMRHPVKLAASLFYYRRIATWEPTYRPDYKDMTLLDYVATDGYYDNWMVRMLTNAKLGGLNEGHLELAKKIIKEKFIIGISDHMDETFRHLEKYYGWAESKEGCVNFHLHSAPSNKNKYPSPDRGGEAWKIITEKNKYDMALYYFALEIFGDQSEKFREV